jgi:hypothetical protein
MDAGIGDYDVEASHRFLGFAEQWAHLRGFRNAGLNRYGPASLRRDRFDDLLRQLFVARVVDDDGRSFGSKFFADRSSDTA